ncbi:MAG: hypothetical protein OEU87_04100, partial [Nitrospira sp.]|nr:hypothetical protein [Nitrospira sp.]
WANRSRVLQMGKREWVRILLARIIHDGSSRNRGVASRERRACPPKACRSSESAIAAEAFMNNAG